MTDPPQTTLSPPPPKVGGREGVIPPRLLWRCPSQRLYKRILVFVPSTTAAPPDLDAALRALADGNRRRILALVRDQAGAVGEIAERVAMSQQAVSHHLRVLRGAGLVTEERDGTRHLFRVRTDGLRVVEEFLDGFWPTHLAALKHAAEATTRRSRVLGSQDD